MWASVHSSRCSLCRCACEQMSWNIHGRSITTQPSAAAARAHTCGPVAFANMGAWLRAKTSKLASSSSLHRNSAAASRIGPVRGSMLPGPTLEQLVRETPCPRLPAAASQWKARSLKNRLGSVSHQARLIEAPVRPTAPALPPSSLPDTLSPAAPPPPATH